MLEMQGVGFIMRKAIGVATVTIHLKHYKGDDGLWRIDAQNNGSGAKGNSEARVLDWKQRPHTDNIFGSVLGQTHFVTADKIKNDAFLKEGWLEGPEEAKGPNGESHIESHVINEERGWEVWQVWGFQLVNGERRHVRKVVCEKAGKRVQVKLVYDFNPYAA